MQRLAKDLLRVAKNCTWNKIAKEVREEQKSCILSASFLEFSGYICMDEPRESFRITPEVTSMKKIQSLLWRHGTFLRFPVILNLNNSRYSEWFLESIRWFFTPWNMNEPRESFRITREVASIKTIQSLLWLHGTFLWFPVILNDCRDSKWFLESTPWFFTLWNMIFQSQYPLDEMTHPYHNY